MSRSDLCTSGHACNTSSSDSWKSKEGAVFSAALAKLINTVHCITLHVESDHWNTACSNRTALMGLFTLQPDFRFHISFRKQWKWYWSVYDTRKALAMWAVCGLAFWWCHGLNSRYHLLWSLAISSMSVTINEMLRYVKLLIKEQAFERYGSPRELAQPKLSWYRRSMHLERDFSPLRIKTVTLSHLWDWLLFLLFWDWLLFQLFWDWLLFLLFWDWLLFLIFWDWLLFLLWLL